MAPLRILLLVVIAVLLVGSGALAWYVFLADPLGSVVPPKAAKQQGQTDVPDPDGEHWLQDFATAREQAAREDKDILLSFEGSDWCIWCERMEREILDMPHFLEEAKKNFVLVKVDFPQGEPARSRVRDPQANAELQKRFGVTGYPAIILTDENGDVYGGINGFVEGGPARLLDGLAKMQAVRVERDRLLEAVDAAQGAEKLAAARTAIEFMNARNLDQQIKQHLPEWLKLAEQFDPANKQGYLEQFFEFDWYYRFRSAKLEELPALLTEMERWREQHGGFKDKERAAFLWMELARAKVALEDYQGAFMCLAEGMKLDPRDPRVRQALQHGPLALGLGTGTAFAVSKDGHYLTNYHVAAGPGKVFVQRTDSSDLMPAQIVAEHREHDLLLLKVDLPKDDRIQPLPIDPGHQPRRGEEVGVWGFPLGTAIGRGLKLTKGVISALPEPANRDMILLDVKINPGNSGSPLCDTRGRVIGIVSARSFFPGAADAYGLALPSKQVDEFLQSAKIATSSAAEADTLSWEEIDRRVSPTMAMVIKARPRPTNAAQ